MSKRSNKTYPISIRRLVKEIRENLNAIEQWKESPDSFCVENVLQYTHYLECLVEFLECYDCGSTGGFGDGQGGGIMDLHERADWLIDKYKGVK